MNCIEILLAFFNWTLLKRVNDRALWVDRGLFERFSWFRAPAVASCWRNHHALIIMFITANLCVPLLGQYYPESSFSELRLRRSKMRHDTPTRGCFNSSLANQRNSHKFGVFKWLNSRTLRSHLSLWSGKVQAWKRERRERWKGTSSETVVLVMMNTRIVVTVAYWSLVFFCSSD